MKRTSVVASLMISSEPADGRTQRIPLNYRTWNCIVGEPSSDLAEATYAAKAKFEFLFAVKFKLNVDKQTSPAKCVPSSIYACRIRNDPNMWMELLLRSSLNIITCPAQKSKLLTNKGDVLYVIFISWMGTYVIFAIYLCKIIKILLIFNFFCYDKRDESLILFM